MNKCLFIICAVFSTAFSGFFDSGRNELGGGLLIYNSDDNAVYQISPVYNYYISDQFSIGPIINIAGVSDKTEIDLGLRIGLGAQLQKSFVYFSPGIAYVSVSNYDACAIPMSFGIKTLIAAHFGIDTHFDFNAIVQKNQGPSKSFGIAVGFFGLL